MDCASLEEELRKRRPRGGGRGHQGRITNNPLWETVHTREWLRLEKPALPSHWKGSSGRGPQREVWVAPTSGPQACGGPPGATVVSRASPGAEELDVEQGMSWNPPQDFCVRLSPEPPSKNCSHHFTYTSRSSKRLLSTGLSLQTKRRPGNAASVQPS